MSDFRSRIQELSPEGREQLARVLSSEIRDRNAEGRDPRLVAYVVARDGLPPSVADLRAYLKARVPDHMVPSAFAIVDRFPRTPNGKLDVDALASVTPIDAMEIGRSSSHVAPQTETEVLLTAIWSDVLDFEDLSVDDNFFEIGGDSILSIQIVARARQVGLRMTPDMLFEHQTIAELARAIPMPTASAHAAPAGTLPVTGDAALTPIQRWFFDQEMSVPQHWNQSILLESPDGVRYDLIQKAVDAVFLHHDALRIRFESGGQYQTHLPADTRVLVEHVDLSAVDAGAHETLIGAKIATLEASFDLLSGPLISVAAFDLGHGMRGRLFFAIHHLIVDPISWQILLSDFETAYRQLFAGESVKLGERTTSFRDWSSALLDYAKSDQLLEQEPYWLSEAERPATQIPVDISGGVFVEASLDSVAVTLAVDQTSALLTDVHRAYNTQIDDVLLAALCITLGRWTSSSEVRVGLERHGREAVKDGLDLSRSVGWFTSFFPMRLRGAHGTIDAAVGEQLKATKEQLRQVPDKGVGYGVLRYLAESPDQSEKFRSTSQPEVIFNYAGRIDAGATYERQFKPIGRLEASRAPSNKRRHLLEVNAFVSGGALTVRWEYSTRIHHRHTIEQLAGDYVVNLGGLIAHCLSADSGGYTPSDFPDVEMSQADLDDLLGNL